MINHLEIAILKETKNPPDKRVPLSPEQCKKIMEQHPNISISVQKSDIRIFDDSSYINQHIKVIQKPNDAQILIGIKEVNLDFLIPFKTYFFFSHTIKEQPYNRSLLKKMLELKITMIDWETLVSVKGNRLIGFGKYAGIAGCYNAFLGYGKKYHLFNLKPAYRCKDRLELENELLKVSLPKKCKIVLTGEGRVARGAKEILEKLNVKLVSPEDFKNNTFNEPVYCQLTVLDYYKKSDNKPFSKEEFYSSPIGYDSNFNEFSEVADIYIAAHFWSADSPQIFNHLMAKSPLNNIKVIADISCDVNGPIVSTLRSSTIEDPFYGYDPIDNKEVNYLSPSSILVMAVDNLPCELPADASIDFGNEFIENILPHIINEDKEGILANATICKNGELTPNYAYLQNYVNGTKA